MIDFNTKIKPMLAYPAKPFNDPNFIYEIKFDGTRTIAYVNVEEKKIKFLNRRMIWFEHRYPELHKIYEVIDAKKVILDGEIVVFEEGKPNFYKLAEREHVDDEFRINLLAKTIPATFVVFDILYKDGEDLTLKPLLERKELLEKVVSESEEHHLLLSRYIEEKGEIFFEKCKKIGLEGVVAKRKDSVYEIGRRSKNWRKIKALQTVDAVICGYTKGEGRRKDTLGALLLAMYDGGKLRYIGRVGTGFDDATLRQLKQILDKLKTDRNPFEIFEEEPHIVEKMVFTKPVLVAEVKFMEWTKDKKLRASSFVRLRSDKPPEECKI